MSLLRNNREPWLTDQFVAVNMRVPEDPRLDPRTGDVRVVLGEHQPEFYVRAGHMVLGVSQLPSDSVGRHWVGVRNTDRMWSEKPMFVGSDRALVIGRTATPDL